ncbi:MAG TPA: type IV pilin protein [Noviherbaspirillum sp.]
MKNAGFTLIELLVAVAIIGILAAIALPSYTQYVQRSRIAEATGELSIARVRLEQFYQDNRHYGSTDSTCGNGIGTASMQFFDLSCRWGDTNNNQSFVITATGKGAMDGFSFTLDDDNARQTTAFPGDNGVPRACWISRAGETC